MSEITPEEIADRVMMAVAEISDSSWEHVEDTEDAIGLLHQSLLDQIRAAVLAERERCAKIDPMIIGCPLCGAGITEPCWNHYHSRPYEGFHYSRFSAAIRAEPEEKDGLVYGI